MEPIKVLSREDLFEQLPLLKQPYHADYLAMYSTVLGGVVTDPTVMTVPIDDHMVHRGDGIFETFKCVEGGLYNLEGHLSRLLRSTQDLAFVLPLTVGRLREIILETVRIGAS